MDNAIFIKHNGRHVRVNYNDIIYIEDLKNYIKINTTEKNYLILISLKRLIEVLPPKGFHRVHKSYIISLQHLTEFNFNAVWLGKIKLPMSDFYGRTLAEKLNVLGEEKKVLDLPIRILQPRELMKEKIIVNGS